MTYDPASGFISRGAKCNKFVRDAYVSQSPEISYPMHEPVRWWQPISFSAPSVRELREPSFNMPDFPIVSGTAIGKEVKESDLAPGDIIVQTDHAMIYLGDGEVAQASSTGRGVSITPLVPTETIFAVRRYTPQHYSPPSVPYYMLWP
jgi:hypothetical protein